MAPSFPSRPGRSPGPARRPGRVVRRGRRSRACGSRPRPSCAQVVRAASGRASRRAPAAGAPGAAAFGTPTTELTEVGLETASSEGPHASVMVLKIEDLSAECSVSAETVGVGRLLGLRKAAFTCLLVASRETPRRRAAGGPGRRRSTINLLRHLSAGAPTGRRAAGVSRQTGSLVGAASCFAHQHTPMFSMARFSRR